MHAKKSIVFYGKSLLMVEMAMILEEDADFQVIKASDPAELEDYLNLYMQR